MNSKQPTEARSAASEPRREAVQALKAVLSGGRSLAEVAPDDPLAKATVYGVLRWLPLLRALLGRYLHKPLRRRDQELELLLLVGIYQLGWLDKPSHAVLNETVRVARQLSRAHSRSWAPSLVNAVLRNYQREGFPRVVDDGEILCAHPEWLLRRIRDAWPARAARVLVANNQQAPLWLRVNLRQISRDAYLERLSEAGLAASASPQAASALRLDQACPVTQLPGFSDGLVSVQDLAAQLVAPLLLDDLEAGARVLDACAAPGGKTAHLLELAPELRLLAIDKDARRSRRIGEAMDRLQLPLDALEVTVADLAGDQDWFDGEPFARILLDAPCSATGVIRRHPDIKWLRREQDIAALSAHQSRLLASGWQLLKPGGRLLYTTCSILPEENARQIAAFLNAQSDANLVELPAELGFDTGAGVQRLPGDDDGDGFFYALLAKTKA